MSRGKNGYRQIVTKKYAGVGGGGSLMMGRSNLGGVVVKQFDYWTFSRKVGGLRQKKALCSTFMSINGHHRTGGKPNIRSHNHIAKK